MNDGLDFLQVQLCGEGRVLPEEVLVFGGCVSFLEEGDLLVEVGLPRPAPEGLVDLVASKWQGDYLLLCSSRSLECCSRCTCWRSSIRNMAQLVRKPISGPSRHSLTFCVADMPTSRLVRASRSTSM